MNLLCNNTIYQIRYLKYFHCHSSQQRGFLCTRMWSSHRRNKGAAGLGYSIRIIATLPWVSPKASFSNFWKQFVLVLYSTARRAYIVDTN